MFRKLKSFQLHELKCAGKKHEVIKAYCWSVIVDDKHKLFLCSTPTQPLGHVPSYTCVCLPLKFDIFHCHHWNKSERVATNHGHFCVLLFGSCIAMSFALLSLIEQDWSNSEIRKKEKSLKPKTTSPACTSELRFRFPIMFCKKHGGERR